MPGFDPFGQWTGVAFQVGIDGGVPVGVIQIQGESVAGGRCFDATHMARSGCQHRDTGIPPGSVIQARVQMVGTQFPKNPRCEGQSFHRMNKALGKGPTRTGQAPK